MMATIKRASRDPGPWVHFLAIWHQGARRPACSEVHPRGAAGTAVTIGHRTLWRNAQKNCHRAAKTRVSHWSPLFPPLPEYYGQLAVSGDCRWNKRILQSLHQNSIRIQISFHKFRASYTTRDRISRKGVDTICVQVLKVACRF